MNWLIVKNFGSIKYFNISYIIMVGVPLLATVYHSIENSWLNEHIDFDFPQGFKWMYCASISYAAGIALYQFFCPKEIKRFDTSDEYINAYLKLYERAYPDKKLNIIQTNMSAEQADTMDRINTLDKKLKDRILTPDDRQALRNEYNILIDLVYPGCVQRFLLRDFEAKSIEKPWASLFSSIFYFIGTVILIVLIICRAILVFKA